MEGSIKDHLVNIVNDINEEGEVNLEETSVVFEWTYPETNNVTYTLIIGLPVLEDSGEFSSVPSIN